MKKNAIAVVLAAVMCSGAHASEKALDALSGAAGAVPVNDISIETPRGPAERADEWRGKVSVYVNDSGCRVSAEERANGVILYVQDGAGKQAVLGFTKDYRGGDIFSFCSPAAAELNGKTLKLSCGEQNSGGYPTRGAALVEMNNGLTGVSVRGEVKRALGWRTDTDISCGGLRPEASKAAAGLSGTYRRSDGYTSGTLTVREFSQNGARKLEFSLSAATAGGHTGDIDGVAAAGKDGSFSFRGSGGCSLSIRPVAGGLAVSGADESCQDHLGMNVFVDGEYLGK